MLFNCVPVFVFFVCEHMSYFYELILEINDGNDPKFVATHVKNRVFYGKINAVKRIFEFGEVFRTQF